MAAMHATGLALPPDDARALLYLASAHRAHNLLATAALGYVHLHGLLGAQQSCSTAGFYLDLVGEAALENRWAPHLLSSALPIARLSEIPSEVASSIDSLRDFEYRQVLAAAGDVDAQFSVGAARLQGLEGVPIDVPEGINWLRRAAGTDVHGRLPAKLQVGPADARAIPELPQSPPNGRAHALALLGYAEVHKPHLLPEPGDGLHIETDADVDADTAAHATHSESLATAFAFYRASALHGSPLGWTGMGYVYTQLGPFRNMRRALYCYNVAIGLGAAEANFRSGQILAGYYPNQTSVDLDGSPDATGVPLDLPEARLRFAKAHRSGLTGGTFFYGRMLVRGEGGPADCATGTALLSDVVAGSLFPSEMDRVVALLMETQQAPDLGLYNGGSNTSSTASSDAADFAAEEDAAGRAPGIRGALILAQLALAGCEAAQASLAEFAVDLLLPGEFDVAPPYHGLFCPNLDHALACLEPTADNVADLAHAVEVMHEIHDLFAPDDDNGDSIAGAADPGTQNAVLVPLPSPPPPSPRGIPDGAVGLAAAAHRVLSFGLAADEAEMRLLAATLLLRADLAEACEYTYAGACADVRSGLSPAEAALVQLDASATAGLAEAAFDAARLLGRGAPGLQPDMHRAREFLRSAALASPEGQFAALLVRLEWFFVMLTGRIVDFFAEVDTQRVGGAICLAAAVGIVAFVVLRDARARRQPVVRANVPPAPVISPLTPAGRPVTTNSGLSDAQLPAETEAVPLRAPGLQLGIGELREALAPEVGSLAQTRRSSEPPADTVIPPCDSERDDTEISEINGGISE
jgi:TPR repeat protein